MSKQHPLIELRNVGKRFGGVVALEGMNLVIDPGEVVGLVGDNGAGKSTLIKILAGAHPHDSGLILIEGQRVTSLNPNTAKTLGIETVYQDLALVDTLDVPGNIFLGRELIRFGAGALRVLDKPGMDRRSQQLLDRLEVRLPHPELEVGLLSGGQRQSVAISRALFTNPKLVILDEPTSALAVREVEHVLALVRQLREQQVAVLFISHVLQEVFAVTDRIVVLRKGRKVTDLVTAETSLDTVVGFMVGQLDGESRA